MSYTYVLELDVPEEMQSEGLIQRYGAFVNMRRLYFDSYVYPRSKLTISDYKNHGKVQLTETVSGKILDPISESEMENISTEYASESHKLDSQGIFALAKKLREAAKILDEKHGDRNWCLSVELNLIPLLEFAICNGFCVTGYISK